MKIIFCTKCSIPKTSRADLENEEYKGDFNKEVTNEIFCMQKTKSKVLKMHPQNHPNV